jgi:predicted amidohydrolase
MFERDGNDIYNTHLVAFPDERLEGQRKGALTPKESAVLRPEKERIAFQWKDIRFSILVCADNALPDWRDQIRRLDLRLLLHPSAGSLPATDGPAEESLRREESPCLDRARQVARELNLTYVVSNPIGFSGEDYYPGNSWIINSRGETLVHLPATARVERMKDVLAAAPLN